jgi:hypothetical protein
MRWLPLLALAACAATPTHAVPTATVIATSPVRTPTDPARVKLLFTELASHDYVEHGLVRVDTFADFGATFPTYQDMLDTLRRAAAAYGCDGVLLRPLGFAFNNFHKAYMLEGVCLVLAAAAPAAPQV